MSSVFKREERYKFSVLLLPVLKNKTIWSIHPVTFVSVTWDHQSMKCSSSRCPTNLSMVYQNIFTLSTFSPSWCYTARRLHSLKGQVAAWSIWSISNRSPCSFKKLHLVLKKKWPSQILGNTGTGRGMSPFPCLFFILWSVVIDFLQWFATKDMFLNLKV